MDASSIIDTRGLKMVMIEQKKKKNMIIISFYRSSSESPRNFVHSICQVLYLILFIIKQNMCPVNLVNTAYEQKIY